MRADGALGVATCRQAAPSYSQVSPWSTARWLPPNSTRTPRRASNAIAVASRSDGPLAGLVSVHASPSHSHVSSKNVNEPTAPPNSTVTPRTAS